MKKKRKYVAVSIVRILDCMGWELTAELRSNNMPEKYECKYLEIRSNVMQCNSGKFRFTGGKCRDRHDALECQIHG